MSVHAEAYRPLLTLDLQGDFREQWDWKQELGQAIALPVPAHFLVRLPDRVMPDATIQLVACLGDPKAPYDQSKAIMEPLGSAMTMKGLYAGGSVDGRLKESFVQGDYYLTLLSDHRLAHLQIDHLWLGPASNKFLACLYLSITEPGKPSSQRISLDLVPSVSSSLTAALRTDRAGNVFSGQEPCTVELSAFRTSGSPRLTRASLDITDDFTKRRRSFPVKLDLSSSAALHQQVRLPLDHYGIFTVTLRTGSQKIVSLQAARIAQAKPSSDASPFGINLFQGQNWAYTFDLPLMAKAGIKWVRPWLAWENNAAVQQPVPGRWDWKPLDATLDRCDQLSLSYAYMFWTAGPTSFTTGSGPTTWWSDTALGNQGWTEYAKTVVNRYKGRVHVWEFWNEPYSFTTGTAYEPLVEALDAGVKAADPAASRIGMGGSVAPPFTQEFVAAGGLKHCDAVSCHLYSQAMPPGTAPEDFIPQELDAQEVLLQSGSHSAVPIWLNEVSYSADDFHPTYHNTIGTTELVQAQFLVRTYLLALAKSYVKKVFWFCTIDPRSPNSGAVDASVGVTYLDRTPKLAYAALSTLCRQMGTPTLIGRLDFPAPARVYAWKVGGKAVITAWSDGAPIRIHLPFELGRAAALDMMGNPLPVSGKKIRPGADLELTGSPLYVSGIPAAEIERHLIAYRVKVGTPEAFAPHSLYGYQFYTSPGIELQPGIPAAASVHITNALTSQTLSIVIDGIADLTVTPAKASAAIQPGKEVVLSFQMVCPRSVVIEPLVVQARDGIVHVRLRECPVVYASDFKNSSAAQVKQMWTPTADFYDALSWDAPGFSWEDAGYEDQRSLKLGQAVGAWTGFESAAIAVKPNTPYMLTYADKTDSAAPESRIWTFIIDGEIHHQAYPTTIMQTYHTAWAQDSSVFRTTANAKTVNIKLQKDDKIKGNVWFDDIRLVELTPSRD